MKPSPARAEPSRASWFRPATLRIRLTAALAASAMMLAVAMIARATADDDPAGGREGFPTAYAIRDAKIVAAPGKVLDPGTIVVRRGTIEAVGLSKETLIPDDAEVIEGKGLVVYPGFLDLYTTAAQKAGVDRSASGKGRLVDLAESPLAATPGDNRRGLTPEFEVAPAVELADSAALPYRKLGFTDILAAPSGSIATGQSAVVSLSGLPRREVIVKTPVALHVQVSPPTDTPAGGGQPGMPFGPQQGPRRRPGGEQGGTENPYPRSLMGAVAHFRQAMLDADRHQRLMDLDASGPGAPYDPALVALGRAAGRKLPVWWQAQTRDEIHRALDLAAEFGTTAVVVGGREAPKVLDRLKAERVPVVLTLDFPEEPKVPTEEEYRKKTAAEQDEPLRLLNHRHELWKERVGTAATLAKAGIPFAFSSEGIDRLDRFAAQLRALKKEGLTEDQILAGLTKQAAAIAGLDGRLGTLEPGKLGHLVAFSAPFLDENAKVKLALIDGQKLEVKESEAPAGGDRPGGPGGRRGGPGGRGPGGPDRKEVSKKADEPKAKDAGKKADEPKAKDTKKDEAKPAEKPAPFVDVAIETEADRKPKTRTGGNVLIKDATILTVTKGTIAKGSILVEKGKIAAIGPDLPAKPGVAVIDAAGLVAMPGIIDTHSHMAIQGGVNEMSLSVVPEVRVKDVVIGDDATIYRALAGGTTLARLLHGSANTIGGQDAVIKLRYGQPGRDLILRDAPQGVKFALGENVTRSRGRFPNTRMGVESVLERAFDEARAYRAEWARYEADRKAGKKVGPPPRQDLRLEALARILEGSIKIHSHCYRADEILMLLRTAEKYGVRVQSLQHVLEGYKVAAEIAAHGASSSTFSDWWAYKIEAYDAIPQNAALLAQAGADVCIKSDSEELIRHLNLEAAKSVRYGGMKEQQALAMVTINAARQLGLDGRLGSIEVGKDADIALFNAHPFDAFSRCELTLVDGEVYFERAEPDGKHGARPGDHRAMPQPADPARVPEIALAEQPKGLVALRGAKIHPVSGPEIPDGNLIIADGKIAAVGPAASTPIPAEAQIVEVKGMDVWPGMVDAGTTIGLSEIGSLTETQDSADAGRFDPELRASSALRADSEHIPVTRIAGVLSSFVEPGGGLIAGQGCVINLRGWVPRELVVKDAVALCVNIPTYVPPPADGARRRPGMGQPPGEGPENQEDPQARRKEQLELIRTWFKRAARYGDAVAAARSKGTTPPPVDIRLAALAPYAKGEALVIFSADQRMEILDALAIAKDLKLKAAITGANEGWKVAKELKASGIPVIVGGVLNELRHEHEPYDSVYANPAKLHAAGVKLALSCRRDGSLAAAGPRNLPFEAATAAAFGLPEDIAVRSVTLTAAEVLGVADQLGSLDPGKRANVVITAGHLLQPTTRVLALFIDGRFEPMESRHTRLYARYQERLKDVQAGRAPLGLERSTNPSSGSGGTPAARPTPPALR
ncbi:amidohydrolase family protein [Aquisphaera insulae]|uniref:amidohydrolase family protein n=1 Tax=Aquisphaera insulae TaxID=2712864 RepID=UPI00202FB979|nr:amidohydrolase family protein [Aquisphaera insulae]